MAKIEVFEDGKMVLQLEAEVSYRDIVVLPKKVADNCLMTSRYFDELFYSSLQGESGLTHEQAYNRAERIHERYLGKRRYENFESFRKSRDQRVGKGR